ncbi:hypothetical protein [Biformimicrobium ophioploci]|uniref:Uncharacterized protein n=1 Tax=Biformimicrobium ophioploci TaxID=3036711 RepID=A0ABQ6M093_9GAMM|nr:hypothetical protein [Microbulbifer sp. NKW57]GMG87763.1 hypothetical protein MNKW57_20840 [Microbulbifer sp. NKW57]
MAATVTQRVVLRLDDRAAQSIESLAEYAEGGSRQRLTGGPGVLQLVKGD